MLSRSGISNGNLGWETPPLDCRGEHRSSQFTPPLLPYAHTGATKQVHKILVEKLKYHKTFSNITKSAF